MNKPNNVYVLTLNNEESDERLKKFHEQNKGVFGDTPLTPHYGLDGSKDDIPTSWTRGRWDEDLIHLKGSKAVCYSHLSIIFGAIGNCPDINDYILVVEDDVTIHPEYLKFLTDIDIPDDWDFIHLSYWDTNCGSDNQNQVSDNLSKIINPCCTGLFSYLVKPRKVFQRLVDSLPTPCEIDNFFTSSENLEKFNIYVVEHIPWLSNHVSEESIRGDIDGKSWRVAQDVYESSEIQEIVDSSEFILCPRGDVGEMGVGVREALSCGNIPIIFDGIHELSSSVRSHIAEIPLKWCNESVLTTLWDEAHDILSAPHLVGCDSNASVFESKPELYKSFCYVTPTHLGLWHHHKASKPDDIYLHTEWAEQSSSGNYEQDDWSKTMLHRLDCFVDWLKLQPSDVWCLHVDSDVVWRSEKAMDVLSTHLDENCLIVGQDDGDVKPVMCGGFFFVRNTPETINYFEQVRECMVIRGVNDQIAINQIIESSGISAKCFPRKLVWCPSAMWTPNQPLNIPKEAVVHHANWTVGVENKLNQIRIGYNT